VPDGRIYGSMKGLIEVIAETIELRGPYTAGHHERVSGLAVAIAREMGLADLQVEGIELASAVYDIGTVNIPADILREGERLEGIALSIYQAYPGNTYDMLKKVEFLWPIADIVPPTVSVMTDRDFPGGSREERSSSRPGSWRLPPPWTI
jgi:putative two-component system response regulator